MDKTNISFRGKHYKIDSEALSDVKADLISHFETSEGDDGLNVFVGGVKYPIGKAVTAEAIDNIKNALNELCKNGSASADYPAAGLYETGAIALYSEQGADAIKDKMITSWEDLVAGGVVHVEDCLFYTNYDAYEWENTSSDTLAGDLILPNDAGIKVICKHAFNTCECLTGIMIPEGVTTIGESAFYYCTKVVDIVLPSSLVTLINTNLELFNSCEVLKSITIPKSATFIGDLGNSFTSVFDYCECLEDVNIEDGHSTYSSSEGIVYNKTLTELVFCPRAKNTVYIPDSVTTICDRAFSGCTSLTSVEIPDGVTTIDDYAFSGCSSLTSVVIPDGVTFIGAGALQGCSFTSITIPDSVTTIGESAFNNCSSLTSVVIGDNVTTIDDYTFRYCTNLESIVIPSSVSTIGKYALGECRKLATIIFCGTVAQWNNVNKGEGWALNAHGKTIRCSNGTILSDLTILYD